jgi:AcrR family transcriptional regulator
MRTARDRILDAAARLLVREGAEAVTIAAVAREAEVSKGGLFYHFPSKEVMIEQLVARYVESFDSLVDAAGDEPGAATSAYLSSAEHPAGPATPVVAALLAAVALTPRGLESLRARYRSWQRRLDDDGIPPHVAATIRFAVDGIWLADTFDLAPINGDPRRDLMRSLRLLISESLTRP